MSADSVFVTVAMLIPSAVASISNAPKSSTALTMLYCSCVSCTASGSCDITCESSIVIVGKVSIPCAVTNASSSPFCPLVPAFSFIVSTSPFATELKYSSCVSALAVMLTAPIGSESVIVPVKKSYSLVAPVAVILTGNFIPLAAVNVTVAVPPKSMLVAPVAVRFVSDVVIVYVITSALAVMLTVSVGLVNVTTPVALLYAFVAPDTVMSLGRLYPVAAVSVSCTCVNVPLVIVIVIDFHLA